MYCIFLINSPTCLPVRNMKKLPSLVWKKEYLNISLFTNLTVRVLLFVLISLVLGSDFPCMWNPQTAMKVLGDSTKRLNCMPKCNSIAFQQVFSEKLIPWNSKGEAWGFMNSMTSLTIKTLDGYQNWFCILYKISVK